MKCFICGKKVTIVQRMLGDESGFHLKCFVKASNGGIIYAGE